MNDCPFCGIVFEKWCSRLASVQSSANPSVDISLVSPSGATRKLRWWPWVVVLCLVGLGYWLTHGDRKDPSVASPSPNGDALHPIIEEGKVGYISTKGRVVIKPQFENGRKFSEGLAAVRIKGKWGYVNKLGQIIIQPKYSGAAPFREDRSFVQEAPGAWAIIDSSGNIVTTTRFGEKSKFSFGLAVVSGPKREYYYVNKSGQVVLGPFLSAGLFSEGLACVIDGDRRRRFIDPNGTTVIALSSDVSPTGFKEGLSCFENQSTSLYGFMDKLGKVVLLATYKQAFSFSDGLAYVETQDERRGFIDHVGKMVIPLGLENKVDLLAYMRKHEEDGEYNEGLFSEGFTVLTEDGGSTVFFVDKTGKRFGGVQHIFKEVRLFENGLALVETVDVRAVLGAGFPAAKTGYVDRSGKFVWKAKKNVDLLFLFPK